MTGLPVRTERLVHVDAVDTRIARQAFARGLCAVGEGTIACGSSPSTITLHSLEPDGRGRMATLTFDVRNAIHGLEVWPYGWRGGSSARPTPVQATG